jgi:hypothetical protein
LGTIEEREFGVRKKPRGRVCSNIKLRIFFQGLRERDRERKKARQTMRNVHVDREGKKNLKERASEYNSNKLRVVDKERKKKIDQY